jgi:hypothetical protein
VSDLLRDVGLKYSESLPAKIGSVAIPLVVIAWVMYKVYESNSEWRNPLLVGLGALAIVAVVQLPIAIESARSSCRRILVEHTRSPWASSPPWAYLTSKCMSVWPNGPGP